MKNKVLILYTAIGQGHKSMAENIGANLVEHGFEVRLEDIHKVQAGKLVSVATFIHKLINVHVPIVWKWLYMSSLVIYLGKKFRLKIARKHSQNTLDLIESFAPDIVMGVQTTASGVLAYLKKEKLIHQPFGIGFSDFHLHELWLYDEADFYLANIKEQKDQMIELGVPAEKIFICGMMVHKPIIYDPEITRSELGVPQSAKVVLVGTGSLGIGLSNEVLKDFLEQLLAKFIRVGIKVKIIVVCGKNTELVEYLKSSLNHESISILGFFTPMSKIYSIADIFVTKPGGLSTTEALSYELPCAIMYSLPGQEELNIDYLRAYNLIMPLSSTGRLSDPQKLVVQVVDEVRLGEFRQKLRKNPYLSQVVKTDLPEAIFTFLRS